MSKIELDLEIKNKLTETIGGRERGIMRVEKGKGEAKEHKYRTHGHGQGGVTDCGSGGGWGRGEQ